MLEKITRLFEEESTIDECADCGAASPVGANRCNDCIEA